MPVKRNALHAVAIPSRKAMMAPLHASRSRALAAVVTLALVVPFNALAADPTPDPAEPYAKFDVQAVASDRSVGLDFRVAHQD
ncbi:MAG TPA: hypothetical protein VLI21_17450 [Casimicrobiaceae bacterium]|nr:hypothetical protein [Casimicrobiaceae bacterium]